MRSGRHELVDEDVVVGAVTDWTTDDADGKGECGNGRNEVVWADDGCHYWGGDDNAADAEWGDNQDPPEFVKVIWRSYRKSSAACGSVRNQD